MSDITLSKAVRSNLLNLQSTASKMGDTQERLATGMKVNSALDNPTNFFTASSLNSRAGDLGRLLDSVSNAKSTIDAADKGLTAITNLVESAQATARQAQQTSATVETTVAATAGEVSSSGFSGPIDLSGGSDAITFDVAVDGGSAQTITIDGASASAGTANTVDDIDELTDIINSQLTGATATNDGTEVTITSDTTGSSSSVAISSFASTTTGGSSGLANGSNTGAAETTSSSVNPKRSEFVDQYNELLTQIDDLASDASFNGVNLLDGDDLSVQFNEDGSSKLDIAGVSFDSAGLGLTELASTAFDSNTDVESTLEDLNSAVDDLRTQASTFGSNLSVVETRQDFTKDLINTLETGAANLTLADGNEEAANLLALQTRQQLSSTALSLASQADQNVLRLF